MMRQAILIFCCLITMSPGLPGQNISLAPGLYPDSVTVDSGSSGLYVTDAWSIAAAACEGGALTPSAFPNLTATMALADTMQSLKGLSKQTVMVELEVNDKGDVLHIRASRAKDAVLEYTLTQLLNRHLKAIPGHCGDVPVTFRWLWKVQWL